MPFDHHQLATAQQLTPRMRQVLKCVGLGMSGRGIGAELHISHHTAEGYVSDMRRAFNVHTREELAVIACKFGLV